MGVSDKPIYSDNSSVEFRTNQIKPIKSIFDAIKNNLPDTAIFFSKEGMKILQLDGTANFLVNVRLYGENFEHYYCDPENGEEDILVNLSAIHLNCIFKSVKTDDNMFAFVYEKNSDVVRLIFSSDKKSEVRTYTITTQHTEDDIQFGEIEGTDKFPYCLSLPCTDLQAICRDFKTSLCDKITISHDGSKLEFMGSGPAIVTSIQRTGQNTDKLPRDGAERTYSDTFKFSTLHEFSKCQSGGDSKIVKLSLCQGEPIVLHFEVGTLGDMDVAIAAHIPSDVDETV
jgi:proliferating cell nuclear antigen PCNA